MRTPITFTFEVTPKLVKRFFKKVNKNGPVFPYVGTPCWTWLAGKSSGYGSFRVSNQVWVAHRVSWVIHNGPIPDGLDVCHYCDNPPCVNPEHLFTGTNDDNMKDKAKKGRNWNGGKPPLKRGDDNGATKLPQDKADQVKILYATGKYTQRELARIFFISQAQVWNIVNLKQRVH